MASIRPANHAHHSHGPPPSGPSGNLLAQKSHVVAGVRDAYWSDDEEQEEPECPLCIGAMDMDDLNFKPCPCGYQICRFCYHHIKENVNGRCPACRREYSDDNVEWKAMSQDDQKRLQQQKKQKEKEKKELEVLKRGHLPNMRVVQRNVVYVTGLGPRYAKEELIPSLRSHDYFGQYGKITKIVLVKRNATISREATTGVYITYNRREDAARAIAGVDGSPSPGGGGEVMRASYGTTKYCMSFLRNVPCPNAGCMELHEWGDEKDTFTKEDLATLKHAMKDSESRQKFVVAKEADSLPRTASWGTKALSSAPSPKPATMAAIPTQIRAPRTRTRASVPTVSQVVRAAAPTSDSGRSARNGDRDRDRRGHVHTSSSGSAGAGGQSGTPVTRAKSPPSSSRSATPLSLSLPPRPSTATTASSPVTSPVATSPPPIPPTPDEATSSIPKQPLVDRHDSNPGTTLTPPPPTATPAPPPPGLQASYQLSTQAQALLDDVRARRESTFKQVQSPFPDLDRTLEALNDNDFSFSFSLDPKLVPRQPNGISAAPPPALPVPLRHQSPAFKSQFDPFAPISASPFARPTQSQNALPPPPGLARSPAVNTTAPISFASTDSGPAMSPASSTRSPYIGSFDPFSDVTRNKSSPSNTLEDETSRRASRFGFAQKRSSNDAGSSRFGGSAAPSPRVGLESLPQMPLYASSDVVSPAPSSSQQMPQWTYQSQQQEYGIPHGLSAMQFQANVLRGSQQSPGFNQLGTFSPFGSGSNTESALKELLNIGRNQNAARQDHSGQGFNQQAFMDPAIMSMRMSDAQNGFQQQGGMRQAQMMEQGHFGPPPGLANMPPPGLQRQVAESKMANGHAHPSMNGQHPSESPPSLSSPPLTSSLSISGPDPLTSTSASVTSSTHSETPAPAAHSPAFSPSDFPELNSSAGDRPRSQSIAKKSDSKPPRKNSINTPVVGPTSPHAVSQGRSLARNPSLVLSPATSQHVLGAKIEPAPASTLSTPSTTISHLKDEREGDSSISPLVTGPNANRTPLALPAAAPISRKAKRKEGRKKTPATPVTSGPPSRVPSPPTVATPSKNAAASPSVPPTPPASQKETPGLKQSPPTAPVVSAFSPQTTAAAGLTISVPPQSAASLSLSGLPSPIPETPLSAVEARPADTTVPSLSKRERKIMAAKAAEEAAEARALELRQKAMPSDVEPLRPLYADLAATTQLMSELREIMRPEIAVFSDIQAITQKWQAPLPYAPLVDALSVLSAGNASLMDGMPTSSSAISSFQQLLETLTQAISDLLRLLPRITWADNSAFDNAILDILKAEDFMTEGMDDAVEPDGDVAALTLALERRAKWMKVQLAKLEELHRDINKAAVRAIFALNDSGWDAHGTLPKTSGSLERIESLGKVKSEDGSWRDMTGEELESALAEAQTQEREAEARLKVLMKANMDDVLLS